MKDGNTPVWLSVLLGMVGSALTIGVGGIVWFIRRPRLHLLFTADVRGCRVDTPSNVGQQRVLRLFVKNRGWTAAHNVNVCAVKLEYYPQTGGRSEQADEVLDYHLALSDRTVFDLASGAPCDCRLGRLSLTEDACWHDPTDLPIDDGPPQPKSPTFSTNSALCRL
jgi:hypothetical protein